MKEEFIKRGFNPEITKLVDNDTELILFLVAVYFDIGWNEQFSLDIKLKAHQLNLWREGNPPFLTIPLFAEPTDNKFEWVADWIDAFGKINPDRRGTKAAATTRMKRFFQENPEVRKSDVYAARDKYLSTVKDRQFLKSSHKFIYEGVGVNRFSMLEQYVDLIKSTPTGSDGRNSKMKG